MEYLMKLQEEKMMKELGQEDKADQPSAPKEAKDEPKEEAKTEAPKEEADVPISTLLSKMDEAEEVKAPAVKVKAPAKVKVTSE